MSVCTLIVHSSVDVHSPLILPHPTWGTIKLSRAAALFSILGKIKPHLYTINCDITVYSASGGNVYCTSARCAHHIGEGLSSSLPISTREASLVLEHLIHEFSVSSICLCQQAETQSHTHLEHISV